MKDFKNENEEPLESKDDHNIDKVKCVASTAISAAAVKAKLASCGPGGRPNSTACFNVDRQTGTSCSLLLVVKKFNVFRGFVNRSYTSWKPN